MRKVLMIGGITVAAILLFAGGIYLRSRQRTTTPPPDTIGTPPLSLPDPGDSGTTGGNSSGSGSLPAASLTALTQSPVVAYSVAESGEFVVVNRNGEVIRTTSASSSVLSSTKVASLIDAEFSADGSKVLFRSGDADAPRWSVYDLKKNAWRILPIDTREVVWAPSGERVAYFANRVQASALTVLDLARSDSKAQSLLTLAASDPGLFWTESNRIIVGERTSGFVPSTLWAFDVQTRALRPLQEGIYGATIAWGSKDRGLLFSSKSSNGASLSLVGSSLDGIRTFSFLTLPSKCDFFKQGTSTTEMIFCAVPREQQVFKGNVLPESYNKRAIATTDDFSVVNPDSGSLSIIPQNQGRAFDAEDINIVNGAAYFIDRNDGRLYKLTLPK